MFGYICNIKNQIGIERAMLTKFIIVSWSLYWVSVYPEYQNRQSENHHHLQFPLYDDVLSGLWM